MALSDFKADPSYGSPASDIDLRAEMSVIMDRHGYWALLRKRIGDRRCACFNEQTHEADPRCAKCLGAGWAFLDHVVRMRKSIVFGGQEVPQPAGRLDTTVYKIYLQCFVKPDRHDFIAEIAQEEQSLVRDWHIQPNVPLRITRLYDIQHSDDLREAGGRIEFFTCWVELADYGDLS